MRTSQVIWALLLSGCAITSPIWSSAEMEGPPLVSGGKTKILEKCSHAVIQGFPTSSGSSTHCHYAFSTSTTLIEVGKMSVQLNQALRLALPLRPFLKEFRKEYQPNASRHIRYQRYKLYLVALEPAVIVGTPVYDNELSSCTRGFDGGCFYIGSDETMQAHIRYRELPPARPGAFWFVPESGLESSFIPDNAQTVTFNYRDMPITLIKDGNNWRLAPRDVQPIIPPDLARQAAPSR